MADAVAFQHRADKFHDTFTYVFCIIVFKGGRSTKRCYSTSHLSTLGGSSLHLSLCASDHAFEFTDLVLAKCSKFPWRELRIDQ
jgi:hypothetical protein